MYTVVPGTRVHCPQAFFFSSLLYTSLRPFCNIIQKLASLASQNLDSTNMNQRPLMVSEPEGMWLLAAKNVTFVRFHPLQLQSIHALLQDKINIDKQNTTHQNYSVKNWMRNIIQATPVTKLTKSPKLSTSLQNKWNILAASPTCHRIKRQLLEYYFGMAPHETGKTVVVYQKHSHLSANKPAWPVLAVLSVNVDHLCSWRLAPVCTPAATFILNLGTQHKYNLSVQYELNTVLGKNTEKLKLSCSRCKSLQYVTKCSTSGELSDPTHCLHPCVCWNSNQLTLHNVHSCLVIEQQVRVMNKRQHDVPPSTLCHVMQRQDSPTAAQLQQVYRATGAESLLHWNQPRDPNADAVFAVYGTQNEDGSVSVGVEDAECDCHHWPATTLVVDLLHATGKSNKCEAVIIWDKAPDGNNYLVDALLRTQLVDGLRRMQLQVQQVQRSIHGQQQQRRSTRIRMRTEESSVGGGFMKPRDFNKAPSISKTRMMFPSKVRSFIPPASHQDHPTPTNHHVYQKAHRESRNRMKERASLSRKCKNSVSTSSTFSTPSTPSTPSSSPSLCADNHSGGCDFCKGATSSPTLKTKEPLPPFKGCAQTDHKATCNQCQSSFSRHCLGVVCFRAADTVSFKEKKNQSVVVPAGLHTQAWQNVLALGGCSSDVEFAGILKQITTFVCPSCEVDHYLKDQDVEHSHYQLYKQDRLAQALAGIRKQSINENNETETPYHPQHGGKPVGVTLTISLPLTVNTGLYVVFKTSLKILRCPLPVDEHMIYLKSLYIQDDDLPDVQFDTITVDDAGSKSSIGTLVQGHGSAGGYKDEDACDHPVCFLFPNMIPSCNEMIPKRGRRQSAERSTKKTHSSRFLAKHLRSTIEHYYNHVMRDSEKHVGRRRGGSNGIGERDSDYARDRDSKFAIMNATGTTLTHVYCGKRSEGGPGKQDFARAPDLMDKHMFIPSITKEYLAMNPIIGDFLCVRGLAYVIAAAGLSFFNGEECGITCQSDRSLYHVQLRWKQFFAAHTKIKCATNYVDRPTKKARVVGKGSSSTTSSSSSSTSTSTSGSGDDICFVSLPSLRSTLIQTTNDKDQGGFEVNQVGLAAHFDGNSDNLFHGSSDGHPPDKLRVYSHHVDIQPASNSRGFIVGMFLKLLHGVNKLGRTKENYSLT